MRHKNKFLISIFLIVVSIFIFGFDFFPHQNEYGKFVRVGDMHYPRSGHKAVLLQDGRVLIVGGGRKEAEIYDPKTKKFYLTGKMLKQHGTFTATLLNNGNVLITGYSKETELFDPKTETFKLAGNLNYPKNYHTATLLQDGRVLIVGGQLIDTEKDYNHQKFKFAEYSEIYNPNTGKFEKVSKLNIPRSRHASILLNNGNVLVVGGITYNERLSSAEIYDVKNNKFIKLENMNSIRVSPQLIKLENGKILIIAGYANSDIGNKNCTDRTCGWQREIEAFDPEKKRFEEFILNNISEPTSKATLLKNGTILFSAGSKSVHWYVVTTKTSTILYPEKNEIIKGPELNQKRADHTATLLNDGSVLISGGKTIENEKSLKISELFKPNNCNK